MEFEPITLGDKDLINNFLRQRRYVNCECSFGNLYIWQHCFATSKALTDDFLIIRGTEDEDYILPPFGSDYQNLAKVLDEVAAYFHKEGKCFCLHGASPEFKEILQTICPDKYEYLPLRDSWDYVYSRQDLAFLAGRKYHAKRNHLNYFKKFYPDYEYRSLTEDLHEGCLKMAEKWREKKGDVNDPTFQCEKNAIIKGLNYFSELDFRGGVILLGGEVAAFTFGEELNADTAVIHIEKSDPDIRGLYVAVNQEFCQHSWTEKDYINREEDLGIPGLRKAKESYYPVMMNEKYKVVLKQE